MIDPVYEAAVQATEEAIINAMLAAETMTRRRLTSGCRALPHDRACATDAAAKYRARCSN